MPAAGMSVAALADPRRRLYGGGDPGPRVCSGPATPARFRLLCGEPAQHRRTCWGGRY